ncbi:MAG: hypothetical protein AAF439_00715 [Pseudomonadota bacterium]
MLDIYRRKRTRFRVVTLPKSGTYFQVGLLKKLGIKKVKVSHTLGNDNQEVLKPGQRAVMTIRDPRAFFVSMTHWSDARCKQIMAGRDPIGEMMQMKGDAHVEIWNGLTFDEKLRFTITGDHRALYYTWRIPHFFRKTDELLSAKNITTVRFEDFMAWGEDGTSDVQIKTIQKMGSAHGIKFSADEVRAALIQTRGEKSSPTFVRGTTSDWKSEYSPENLAIFQERWGEYVERWGYPANLD